MPLGSEFPQVCDNCGGVLTSEIDVFTHQCFSGRVAGPSEMTDEEEEVVESDGGDGEMEDSVLGPDLTKNEDWDPEDEDDENEDQFDESVPIQGGACAAGGQRGRAVWIEKQKDVLLRAYTSSSVASKQQAFEAYPWFVTIFAKLDDFRRFLKLSVSNTEAPGHLLSRHANERQSLSIAVLSVYVIDGRAVSGAEMLLSIGFDLNENVRTLVTRHLSNGATTTPLDIRSLAKVSLYDARGSDESGVYCLRSRDGSYIIGTAIMSFRRRVDRAEYSTSHKVMNAFDEDDHREGRTDRVVYDTKDLEIYGSHIKWITHGLEAFAIVIFGSTLDKGLNTNVVDRRSIHGGRTIRQIYHIWQTTHRLANSGIRIPAIDTTEEFRDWFKIHVLPSHPEETPTGFYKLVRKIASELVVNPITHFDPLPNTVWKGTVPRARLRGQPQYVVRQGLAADRGGEQEVVDDQHNPARALAGLDFLALARNWMANKPAIEDDIGLVISRKMRGPRIRNKLLSFNPAML